MIMYRWFNVFLMIYGAVNGYESLHANTKVLFFAILTAVGVWLALELFLGFGLYRMAKNKGMGKRAMAFIPFVNMIYAGRLAGDCEFFGQRMKHTGVFVMIVQILLFLAGAFTIFVETSLYMTYVPTVMNNSIVFLKENGGEPTGRLARFFITYDNVSTMLLSILELAYTVLLFIMASALYRKYAPSSSMFLAFLALFVPVSFPIAVFTLRKKQPVDYADYIRKKREAYYRRYGGGYGNNPYGGNPYGGGTYGSRSDGEPFSDGDAERKQPDEPFSEFGGSSDGGSGTAGNSAGGNTEGKNQRDGKDDSPFSDIDG